MENTLLLLYPAALGILLFAGASNSTDTGYAIFASLIIFMFLFPLAGAVNGVWYGWRSRSPMKWLLVPAAFLGVCLFLLAADLISGSGPMEPGAYASLGALTGVTCLAAEVIAGGIARLAGRNQKIDTEREKRDE